MSEYDELKGKTGNRFLAYLGEHRQLIDDVIFDKGPHAPKESFLKRDIDNALYGPLRRFTVNGGKRVRPALVMLGCEAVGGKAEHTLAAAYAVEFFQSAVVIHDDIEDGGKRRRGKPSLHVKEGVGVAVNQGDLAMAAALDYLLNAEGPDDATRMRLLRELSEMELVHMEGQALDLGWIQSGVWDVTPDEYEYMAWQKTAAHTASTPLAMGAICGRGTDIQIKALREFGMSVGLAYQIKDDLLNIDGKPEAVGKDYRSDITDGKRTLLTIHALFELTGAEHDELLHLLEAHTTEPDQLERAVELIRLAGSFEVVQEEAAIFASEAKRNLPRDLFDPDAYEALLSFADFAFARCC